MQTEDNVYREHQETYSTKEGGPGKMSRVSLRATSEFIRKPQEYVLINSTPDVIILEWHAETLRVPPRNKIIPKHPRHLAGDKNFEDVRHSMQRNDGSYVPGTLVLCDIVEPGPYGSRILVWSASEAIQMKLGIDPETGEYQGAYAMRGLSLLPRDADDSSIQEVLMEGIVRWEAWEIEQARRVLLEEEARQNAFKTAGKTLTPRRQYVDQAAAFLEQMGQKYNIPVGNLVEQRVDEAQLTAKVMKEVAAATTMQPAPQSKAQLLAELLEDDDMMELLEKKLDRKRMEKAAAATTTTDDPEKKGRK